MRLVREGRLYDLAHVLDESVPAFPGRYFRQTLVTTAHRANTAMPLGNTAELARDGVRAFALVLTHPRLRGATGAWTSPVALIRTSAMHDEYDVIIIGTGGGSGTLAHRLALGQAHLAARAR